MTVPVKYLAMALLAATAFAFPGPVLRPRPLVLWHGLGDSHSSPGMLEFMELIKETHPGIFVHSVYIEKDLEADRKAGWVSALEVSWFISACWILKDIVTDASFA